MNEEPLPAKRDKKEEFNAWLIGHNDAFIDRVGRILEADSFGRNVVARHSDRHLYAVLKPTRNENLRRINNALEELVEISDDIAE